MIQVGNLSTFSGLFALPSFCYAIGKDHGILNGLMSASTNGKMLWWCEKHWGFGGDTKKNLLSTDNQKNWDNRAIKFRSNLWRILGVWRCWKKKVCQKNASNPAWPCIIFTMSLGCFLGCFFWRSWIQWGNQTTIVNSKVNSPKKNHSSYFSVVFCRGTNGILRFPLFFFLRHTPNMILITPEAKKHGWKLKRPQNILDSIIMIHTDWIQ